MLVKITLFAALLLSIVVPFAYFLSGTKNKARYKLTIGTNAAAFFGITNTSSVNSCSVSTEMQRRFTHTMRQHASVCYMLKNIVLHRQQHNKPCASQLCIATDSDAMQTMKPPCTGIRSRLNAAAFMHSNA